MKYSLSGHIFQSISVRIVQLISSFDGILGSAMQLFQAFLVAQMVKHLPTMQEICVRSLGQEDPLEKEMATHSSTLAWKIPWTKEPGRLQSLESQRVGHDSVTSLHFFMQLFHPLCNFKITIYGNVLFFLCQYVFTSSFFPVS